MNEANARERTVPYYACEHGVPGGCAFCNATATPKPRAGEHTKGPHDSMELALKTIGKLEAERDLLRAREGEVGKLLKEFAECVETLAFRMEAPNEFTPQFVQLAQTFRALLAKHGR